MKKISIKMVIFEMKKVINTLYAIILILYGFSANAEDELPTVGVALVSPPSEVISPQNEEITVTTSNSLVENIKNNEKAIDKQDDSIVEIPVINNSLVDKISDIGEDVKKTATTTLSDMMKSKKEESISSSPKSSERKKHVKRSNASVFDISGAMLRMSPSQIDEALTRRGYKKTVQKHDIPNFIRWRNEEKCRAQGVVGYERLGNCVAQMAKKDNHMFIERVFYSKYDSQEEMEIRFTSNFTQNKSYYLNYKSGVLTNMRGNSQKEFYLRNIKVYDFWKKINQKYGAPDNKDNVIWGLGGNKAYLQAGTGRLVLEDPTLRDLDYTRMSREDKKFMNTGLYNF